jgi:hypothetical protein
MVMLVVAGCQNVADEPATSETVAVASAYPSLHTVPPRPQLSYPLKQRRAIVEGLIADREHARYTSEVVRYRAGLSTMPPPEPKTVAAAPLEDEPEAGDPASARGATASAPPAAATTEFTREDDTLDSFMQDMLDDRAGPERGTPTSPTGEPEASAAPPADALVRPAVAPPERARNAGTTTASDAQLRDPPPAKPPPVPVQMVERTVPEPSEVEASGTDRAGSEPPFRPIPQNAQIGVADGLVAIDVEPAETRDLALGSIAFNPGSAVLPADVRPVLERWLGEANAQGARVKVVAEAAAPALALDRAWAVGLALVQSGLPADRLELSHADHAGGDRARLFLASPAAP